MLLEVSFSPILTAKRPKVGQKQGYEAKLICKATSYPPASISFVHKGKELNNNEHYKIEYLSSVNEITEAILTLNEVKQHHYGEYECKAKNPLGDAKTTLELFGKEVINFLYLFFFCCKFISFSCSDLLIMTIMLVAFLWLSVIAYFLFLPVFMLCFLLCFLMKSFSYAHSKRQEEFLFWFFFELCMHAYGFL